MSEASPAGRADGPQSVGGAGNGQPASRKALLRVVVLLLLVVGMVRGYLYWQHARTHVSTDDAYLTTDVMPITPQVPGKVVRVLVADNQLVHAGDVLVELDDATFRTDLAQARAALAVAEAAARGARTSVGLTQEVGNAGISTASAGLAQAEGAVGGSEAELSRTRAAGEGAAASAAAARSSERIADAAITAAQAARKRALESVSSAQAQLESSVAAHVAAEAVARAAVATERAAQADLRKATADESRYADLRKVEAVSLQVYDAAVAALASARARAESAAEAVNQTGAAVAQAKASVAQRTSELSAARDGVAVAEAAVVQATEQAHSAAAGVKVADAALRQAHAQVDVALRSVTQNRARQRGAAGTLQQANTAPKQVEVSRAAGETAEAKVRQAQAAVDAATIALARTRLVAPADGVISKRTAQVGQQVAVGQLLMAVVPVSGIWVVGNFKEVEMTDVRVAQPVDVAVDMLPGRTYKGRVQSIAAGTGSMFALLPPENATGNFTKLVQRVPVKISLDPGQPGLDLLRGGLSVNATITTGR